MSLASAPLSALRCIPLHQSAQNDRALHLPAKQFMSASSSSLPLAPPLAATKPAELADHPLVIALPVQWGDQDSFGHVNNVVYFRWMESARIEYFRLADFGTSVNNQGTGPILASLKCDFRRQMLYPDQLLVSASVTSIGRTSLKMHHRVYSLAQQAVTAEGDSVLVIYDYLDPKPKVGEAKEKWLDTVSEILNKIWRFEHGDKPIVHLERTP